MKNATQSGRGRHSGPCPHWCTTDGQHVTDHSDTKTLIPATSGEPVDLSPETGASFPLVGVGLVRCVSDGLPDSLVLWLTGAAGVDVDVFLRPAEAAQVAAEIQDRLATLGGAA